MLSLSNGNEENAMGELDGKVAVISGGSSGIGLVTAKRFVEEGAYVFITGRRAGELEKAKRVLGRNVTVVQGDVANLADLDRLYKTVEKEKGGALPGVGRQQLRDRHRPRRRRWHDPGVNRIPQSAGRPQSLDRLLDRKGRWQRHS